MTKSMEHVCLACIPKSELGSLAAIRCTPGITAALDDNRAWISWRKGQEDVLTCLLSIPEVQLYEDRDGVRFALGSHLPAFHLPDNLNYVQLANLIFPQAMKPVGISSLPIQRLSLDLVPESKPQPTSALLTSIANVALWADSVSQVRLEKLRGAYKEEEIILFGENLPPFPESELFWGYRLLVPLGYRISPKLPESAYCQALELSADEVLLFRHQKKEIITRSALDPLSRASLHLLAQEIAS